MSGSTSRWISGLGVLAAVAVAGSWSLIHGHNTEQFRTVRASRGDLLLTVAATGNPNAVVTVQVGSQVSGNILELDADFNSHVTKGQVVARIDPALFEARVQQASAVLDASKSAVVNTQAQINEKQAGVASAKANLAAAEAAILRCRAELQDAKYKWERRAALSNDVIISREDLDTAKANYDAAQGNLKAAEAQADAARQAIIAAEAQLEVARTQFASATAQVKQNEAALTSAQTDLDHTYIRAPVDGVVVDRKVDVGQTVAASLQAPTLFQIAQDLAKMQVDTNVSEADVGKVMPGQDATFTVDAYPGRTFHGSVREIRKAPINVQNVITYDVVIAVDNPDLKLFPGMTATVRIITGRLAGVLKVPNAALRFRPPDAVDRRLNTPAVWSLDTNGKPRRVDVTAGASDGVSTEILSGDLKQGDPVVIASTASSKSARNSGPAPGPRF